MEQAEIIDTFWMYHTPIAPSPKRLKLRKPMKEKAGEKPPASRGVRIQDPTDPPAPRPRIDLTNLVVEVPLASKPPRRLVPAEQRTKERHDTKHKTAGQTEAHAPDSVKASKLKSTVAKPGQTYAQVGTKKMSEAELRKRDRAEAERLHSAAQDQAKADKEAQAKEKADREASLLEKQRKDLDEANQKAEAKCKLAEVKKQEAKAAAEAKQLSEAEAKRKATLNTLRTKQAEKAARAAQKEVDVDMTPKDIAPKQTTAPAPEAQEEAEHSHHNFPDPREGELWDCISLHQVFFKLAEAIDPKAVDVGDIYISPTLTAMIENLYN